MWWYDAEIHCFDQPWQKAAIVAISILSPLPILSSLLMQRWKTHVSLSTWQLEIRRVLTNGFAPKRCWWLGVSLLRRLLLVIAFTTIQDQAWSAVVNTVLCTRELKFFQNDFDFYHISIPRDEYAAAAFPDPLDTQV